MVAFTNRGAEAMLAYRRQHGVTQSQAARASNLDTMLWSRYERAERIPGLENAHRIEVSTGGEVRAEWFLEQKTFDPTTEPQAIRCRCVGGTGPCPRGKGRRRGQAVAAGAGH
jgi:transcriptional regulator with XRE-family HTH domain